MSTRITNQMVTRNVLADLNSTAARLDATRAKASSGREITRPSDDPFGTARALKLRQTLDGTEQYKRNAQDAIGWQEVTEQALDQMSGIVRRVQELVVAAGSDTSSGGAREAAATELGQLIGAIKEHGNATYSGRFIFSGTATTTRPYEDGADDGYKGDGGTIARELGPGVSLTLNASGRDILGDGGTDGKLLGVLRSIERHLGSDDGASLRADLGALDGQTDKILSVRARNGADSSRIEAAISRLDQYAETTTRQLSETEDADFAKTMIDLNSQQGAYQAALKSGANLIQSSLMDFLR